MADDKKKQPSEQSSDEDMQKGGEATATDLPEDTEMSDMKEDTTMEENAQMEHEDEENPKP